MNHDFELPSFVTHYFQQAPFRSLTTLSDSERAAVIAGLDFPPESSHRFHSNFYFGERMRYETVMHDQFAEKGGRPTRRRPHYAVLGESEIWQSIAKRSLRIPLTDISSDQISFTYTDSWFTYVEREADGTVNLRKPQYNKLYRLAELGQLFADYGWPGDRWKRDPDWQNDIYVEAQIWDDASIQPYLPATDAT